MSTRSAVGAETEGGTRAVYVHSDGYPEAKLDDLRQLVAQHGLSKTVATLLATPSGWGYINAEFPAHDGEQLIPGFGARLTRGFTEYMTPEKPFSWDIEYIYIISADGKTIRWAHSGIARASSGGHKWDSLDWQEAPLV